MKEAESTSERSGYSNETTQRYIPEGSNLQNRRPENLKSRLQIVLFLKVRDSFQL
jgi:hypothetical protein